MRCTRCNKIIREVYHVNGKPYGIECAKKQGYSDKKVVIKKQSEIDLRQGDLFNYYPAFEEWRKDLIW